MGISKGFQKFGSACVPPLGIRRIGPVKHTSLPCMCYFAEFGRSKSNAVVISRGPQNWERWGHVLWDGAWLT